ncbi:MAG: hypothetical protein HYT41_02910 [Candidatus Sungbacteria bacterium]|nr:hypothetical protein [Candidatus Sungbacteria bacterium]
MNRTKVKVITVGVLVMMGFLIAIFVSKPHAYSYQTTFPANMNSGGRGMCIGLLYPVTAQNMRGWKCFGISYNNLSWIE